MKEKNVIQYVREAIIAQVTQSPLEKLPERGEIHFEVDYSDYKTELTKNEVQNVFIEAVSILQEAYNFVFEVHLHYNKGKRISGVFIKVTV